MPTNSWNNADVKKYYSENRCEIKDLYKSEKYFLEKIIEKKISILDVGCACGGFYNIFRQMTGNDFNYTGIDISEVLIKEAQKRYPGADFRLSAAAGKLDFPDNSYDLVFSSGLFHLCDEWETLYREAYRVSKSKVLIDFRLTGKDKQIGEFAVDFYGNSPDNIIRYTVLNKTELMKWLLELKPRPARISAYGYMAPPSKMARLDLPEVCMAFFLVEKGFDNSSSETILNLELPLQF